MDDLERQSGGCIKFVPHKNEPQYVNITRNGPEHGCYGTLGYYKNRPSELNLNDTADCYVNSTPIAIRHELFHLLGFHHLHQRVDRDEYIDIHTENIEPDKRSWFRPKLPSFNELVPFDFKSVMLYHNTLGSIDKVSKTITSKVNGYRVPDLNETQNYSENDIRMLNILYQCNNG